MRHTILTRDFLCLFGASAICRSSRPRPSGSRLKAALYSPDNIADNLHMTCVVLAQAVVMLRLRCILSTRAASIISIQYLASSSSASLTKCMSRTPPCNIVIIKHVSAKIREENCIALQLFSINPLLTSSLSPMLGVPTNEGRISKWTQIHGA